MKILRLQSENVKRLSAVDITPGGDVVTIGGKNGAGKSSVLDSIAYALGGQALVPAEPIRTGESEAKIIVYLGEFIVTRKFKRDKIFSCQMQEADPKHVHHPECPFTFGPTNSSLVVTNKDGAKYPTPQAILDKLLGKLTFDPLAFARADAKEQGVILRRLVGVDTVEHDEKRKMKLALRNDLKKQLAGQVTLLADRALFTDVPTEEVPASEATKMLEEAEMLRKKAATALSDALLVQQTYTTLSDQRSRLFTEMSKLMKQHAACENAAADLGKKVTEQYAALTELEAVAEHAKAAVPDVTVIQQRITDIENTNRKVRANVARAGIVAQRDKLDEAVKSSTAELEKMDAKKAAMLDAVTFPVEGLGLSENGVTFGGVPFEQASTSEQLKTSVAIGLALNPTLKVLLVRNGNALDKDSLLAVAEQAAKADAQVWCEIVVSDGENRNIAVMIEDGHVA